MKKDHNNCQVYVFLLYMNLQNTLNVAPEQDSSVGIVSQSDPQINSGFNGPFMFIMVISS